MQHLNWSDLVEALPTLWIGAIVTLQITATAIVVGIFLGTLLALMRLSNIKVLGWFATGYVTFFRSIPLVMVLLWFYLIVPQFLSGVLRISPRTDIRLVSALVAFSLFEAAYYSEIIRAGINAIPKGQLKASLALGMRQLQAMGLIILPQAFKAMMPLLLTQAIILFQDTSLVYVISLADFFRTATNIGDRDGTSVEMILFAGACYFIVCSIASTCVKALQTKEIR